MFEWMLSPPRPEGRSRLLQALWAVGLYVLIGWTWWSGLFGRAEWPTELGDWPKQCLYHLLLRDSVQRGAVPLTIGPAQSFGGHYMDIPETPIGPWNFVLASLLSDSRESSMTWATFTMYIGVDFHRSSRHWYVPKRTDHY